MTTPETVHLYALIALRALADYDPYEFQRSTDISRREVDDRIERLMVQLRYSDDDERRIADIAQKLDALRGLESTSESPATLAYLLRQVGNSSLERAYQLALTMDQKGELRRAPMRREAVRQSKPTLARASQSEPEFLRLGVMRLLRSFSEYEPKFGYRVRNMEVDCFLEPTVDGYPPILVEAKASIPTRAAFEAAVQQLTKVSAGWGKEVIAAIITTNISEEVRAFLQRNRKFLLLEFDPETNEFDPGDHETFVGAVISRAHL